MDDRSDEARLRALFAQRAGALPAPTLDFGAVLARIDAESRERDVSPGAEAAVAVSAEATPSFVVPGPARARGPLRRFSAEARGYALALAAAAAGLACFTSALRAPEASLHAEGSPARTDAAPRRADPSVPAVREDDVPVPSANVCAERHDDPRATALVSRVPSRAFGLRSAPSPVEIPPTDEATCTPANGAPSCRSDVTCCAVAP